MWRFAGASGASFFGAGAAFFASCLKAGVEPMRVADLSRLRAIGSTGSPLSDDCYDWIWSRCPQVDGAPIWIDAISGGTDFAGAFVAGMRTLPVVAGEMQCRCLGAAVEAWSEPDGKPLIDEVGELVCTQPMPSMPPYFWGDQGNRRYLDSYFDMYPGIWRHGDWIRITPRGGAIIYGRSDATINRHGIRMGTAELYRAVEALPQVLDSLVVDLEYLGRESYMPLFVVLRDGVVLDDVLDRRLRAAIKTALSARHVPNEIFQVEAVPRTLSGKKMELPVKKLLLGTPAEQVFKLDAMANAACVAWFVEFAPARGGPRSPVEAATIACAGTAPERRCVSWPWCMRTSVGMLRIWKRDDSCGLSSLLTFTSSARPFSALTTACSNAGAIARHGPHHGAQKSISTGSGLASIAASKLSSASSTGRPSSRGLPQRPQTGSSARRSTGMRLVAPQPAQVNCVLWLSIRPT